MRRFVLLDRDGTINVEKNYLSDPAEVALYPGVGPALRRLQELGFGLAVVTNQSGIARGYFDRAALEQVNARLRDLLSPWQVTLDGIYVCPHGPEEGCGCRKPLPGLVDQAAAELGFDPKAAFLIGDKAADIDLAEAVGAIGLLVRTGWGREAETAGKCRPAATFDDLPAAAAWIERSVQGPR